MDFVFSRQLEVFDILDVLLFQDELAEFLGGILSQSAANGGDCADESEVKRKRKRKVSRDLSQELGAGPSTPTGASSKVSTEEQMSYSGNIYVLKECINVS